MPQGFAAFYVLGIDRNAGHRADLHALGFVKMPHAFGAFAGVDLIDLFTQIDGLVGALGFADITVDAFVGDHQCHGALRKTGPAHVCHARSGPGRHYRAPPIPCLAVGHRQAERPFTAPRPVAASAWSCR